MRKKEGCQNPAPLFRGWPGPGSPRPIFFAGPPADRPVSKPIPPAHPLGRGRTPCTGPGHPVAVHGLSQLHRFLVPYKRRRRCRGPIPPASPPRASNCRADQPILRAELPDRRTGHPRHIIGDVGVLKARSSFRYRRRAPRNRNRIYRSAARPSHPVPFARFSGSTDHRSPPGSSNVHRRSRVSGDGVAGTHGVPEIAVAGPGRNRACRLPYSPPFPLSNRCPVFPGTHPDSVPWSCGW